MESEQTEVTQQNTESSQNAVPKEPESSFVFNEQTLMAALSYFGPLVLIPLLTKKDDSFVLFHARQGFILLLPFVAVYILSHTTAFYRLWFLFDVINITITCLSIVGIVLALQRKEVNIPIVGQLAKLVRF